MVTYLATRVDSEQMKQALVSTDVASKLDFLINQREKGFGLKGLVLLALGLAGSFSCLLISWGALIRFIFPGNEFLFGKRKERFDKRRRFTSNILWIVGVGLVVSVVAGLIVWRFTGSH